MTPASASASCSDANPGVDEWVPAPNAEVVVPSRWILPRARYRGLVVNVPEMRLYMFPTDARSGQRVSMLTWPVGIGVEEAPSPVGAFTVRSKDKNPTWIVPASILSTMEKPQKVVPPGPENPLGAYRIRLSKGTYSIHGTNDPWSIGRLTTHGCIRLYPEDIEALYPLVRPGMPGELVYQPVKLGEDGGRIYAEVHDDVYRRIPNLERYAFAEAAKAGLRDRVDPELLRAAVRSKSGVPVDVTRAPAPEPRRIDFGPDARRRDELGVATPRAHRRSREAVRLFDRVGAHDALADRVADQARRVVDVELGHQPGTVRVHGLRGDAERARDLAIGVPLGDELQDLSLAIRERDAFLLGGILRGEVAIDDDARDVVAEIEAAALDGVDRAVPARRPRPS